MVHTTLNPGSSGHSVPPRGLFFGSIEGVKTGRFDRYLPDTTAAPVDDAHLQELAKFMILNFDETGPVADPGAAIDKTEVVDENATIPAAYTYFGQFVDHDLTLDIAGLSQSEQDNNGAVDFRNPALDLDCIYGSGPADQPYLYRTGPERLKKKRHLLRLGAETGAASGSAATKHDLLRLGVDDEGVQLAVIGDKRNDENKIVAQIQALMIGLHNRIYLDDHLHPGLGTSDEDLDARFHQSVKLTRWHYQWIVLKDYLAGHLVSDAALSDFGNIYSPKLRFYDAVMAGRTYPFMPVEFSGAVYRLGHSMIRPSYALNKHRTGDAATRIPTFGADGATDLRGFGIPITSEWSIDWGFFAEGFTGTVDPGHAAILPQPSYRIDTRVADPLSHLPEFQNMIDAHPPQAIKANLAYRNLKRGELLRLQTGEEVAAALNIVPMPPEVVWATGSKNAVLRNTVKDDTALIKRAEHITTKGFRDSFENKTPLWYYILREAEYYACTRPLPNAYAAAVSEEDKQTHINFGGHYLGPVGSHIVSETFLGLLWYDQSSFLHDSAWRPHGRLNVGGGAFTLSKLIKYALG